MIVRLFSILDAPEAALRFARLHRLAVLIAALLLVALLGVLRTTAPAGAATVTIRLPQPTGTAAPTAAMLEAEGRAILANAARPFALARLQAASPFMIAGTAEDKQLAQRCLTQAVYYEAGYEPLTGRRAVAQVVLNRVRSSAFPNSVCAVVYQGAGTPTCQFTFVCTTDLGRPPSSAAWTEAELVARAALAGYVEPSVGEATHYHADYVAPRWAPLLDKVATIGTHIFYQLPGQSSRASFTQRYAGEQRDPATLRRAGFAENSEQPVVVGPEPSRQARVAYAIDTLLDPPAVKTAGNAPAGAGAVQ